MFSVLFAIGLATLLFLDRVFLPSSARRAWWLMTFTFGLAGAFALYQKPLEEIAHLLGVGRPVDLVMYAVVVLLVREFFLSRIRYRAMEREITRLVRALAIQGAAKVK